MWCRLSTDISERTEVYYILRHTNSLKRRRHTGHVSGNSYEVWFAKQKVWINDNTS